jgi:hypothetical protein
MSAGITLTAKLVRPEAETAFRFAQWDGTPVKAAKVRIDHGDGQDKTVSWRPALSKEGLTQADLAPWNWHEAITAHQQNGGPVIVVKGELKAKWLGVRGITAISINGWSPTLEQQLRHLGDAVVLAPDCDLADLRDWYAKAAAALPHARHLLVPGANWPQPPATDGVGIDDWLQSQPAITAPEILQAITTEGWGGGDVDGDEGREGKTELLTGAELMQFVDMNYAIEWNELKQRAIVNGVMPRGKDKKLFYLDISNRFPSVKVKKEEAQDALDYIARENPFNPIRRYIDGLKEKAARGELQLLKLDDIAAKGFGIGDDDWLSKSLLAHKLVQQLKRGLSYGYKADEMAILRGGQGDYKTEAIKALAPQADWIFTETELKDTNDWKFLLKISQSWIFLFDECDKFLRGKDSSTLKALVSNTHDSYAAKGLNEVDDHPRPSTMWGTTNQSDLFNDHTGVRRWWLMQVADGRCCDPGWIQRNRDSIWATAYTWAMWGLESYLPRGGVVQQAAEARAWGATYSLDDGDDYMRLLNAIPIQTRDGLPLPISKQSLILQASQVDTSKLWTTDRKRARDLLGDVARLVTAGNFRTHDGQIRWEESKRRIDGHPNPVAGFFPVRVAAAGEGSGQQDAYRFQADPIPSVPNPSDAVPQDWNGQTPWQDSVLTSLFQCSNLLEERRNKKGGGTAAAAGGGRETPRTQKRLEQLEHPPQTPSAAGDLPVPILRPISGVALEQAPESAPQPPEKPDPPRPWDEAQPDPELAHLGTAAPADVLARHQQHLAASPARVGGYALGDDLDAFLATPSTDEAGPSDAELAAALSLRVEELLAAGLLLHQEPVPLEPERPLQCSPDALLVEQCQQRLGQLKPWQQQAVRLRLQYQEKPPASLVHLIPEADAPSLNGRALKEFLDHPSTQDLLRQLKLAQPAQHAP